ncbi:hypothetical protein Lal_00042936 [Lupinus albus]|nr:hypothetical protein Lal_00042936 [Lupinus albus]
MQFQNFENIFSLNSLSRGIHGIEEMLRKSDFGSSYVASFGSSDVAIFGSIDVASFGSSDVASFGSCDVASFGSSDVASFGSSDVANFGSSDVASFGSSYVESFGSSDVANFGRGRFKDVWIRSIEASSFKSPLPYALKITAILEHLGVSTTGESNVDLDAMDSKIEVDVIHKIGLFRDPNDLFYKYRSDQHFAPMKDPSTDPPAPRPSTFHDESSSSIAMPTN